MHNPIPSAAVILLKEDKSRCDSFQILLLKRNAKLATHGGSWVFPGGKIDPEDFDCLESRQSPENRQSPEDRQTEGPANFSKLNPDAKIELARYAAVREAAEEAGCQLVESELQLFSRWLTPSTLAKRFDAWFFMAEAQTEEIQIDGGEIHDFQWLSPIDALSLQQQGKLSLPPATYVTLKQLSAFKSIKQAIEILCQRPIHYRPKLTTFDGGLCALYEEDEAYLDQDATKIGKRHRLLMKNDQYQYINDVECLPDSCG